MLSYLKLKNFKSFSDITLDLRGSHRIPKRMAFIYGENGAGKTNLMNSMLFLSNTLKTLVNQENEKQTKILDSLEDEIDIDIDIFKKTLLEVLLSEDNIGISSLSSSSLSSLINKNKNIGNNGNMSIEIGFYIKGKHGTYCLEFDDEKVVFEELNFYINKRTGVIFSIHSNQIFLSPSVFLDNAYNVELLNDIQKFWGKHTFMSILFYEVQTKNIKYVTSRIRNNFFEVLDWLSTYSVLCKDIRYQIANISIPFAFLRNLDNGTINSQNDKELKIFEKSLNTFFTSLYSDVKKVYYDITPKRNKYKYVLMFKKQINGEILDIPIFLESTGTKKLLEIFPYIFSFIWGKTVFIDEIDSSIHDLLMSEIIELLKEYSNGQFIATTHNTLLMEKLSPEDVYIINIDSNGNKKLECTSSYNFRTQKTNNVQKKYLNGDYRGIPYIGFLDLQEIVDNVKEEMSS
ncbi:AAA family ATPase [Clostridium sp. MD294]|uniref:AAA family ATPase n=1 Tax=Clostridium sp. MD294 TaxID=97138 RepID=UPI0002CBC62B|nr:AAA family ATPase [Clostridium sp. MD294]NDO45954.1 AAA family ATPase [Clostridium sp. MD294]USF30387.1 hypothetical protein C820_001828 [Clostridium sp. MD294]